MSRKTEVNEIVKELRQAGIIDGKVQITGELSGTTDGLVFTLGLNGEPSFVLKLDSPQNIGYVAYLHHIYRRSPLLPELLYTGPDRTYMVYTYVSGTTHYNRGRKLDWLSLLVKELLNFYKPYPDSDKWGSLGKPRDSWREFNERSLESARRDTRKLLPDEDYEIVKRLLASVSEDKKPYLLHGDTGVHNFVFRDFTLAGVIDPWPIVGPLIYDFTYAFCSSPDDLNLETLLAAFALLDHEPMEQTKLIEEVTFQLYCRIGICARLHPHDLEDYLKAWDYWKALVR